VTTSGPYHWSEEDPDDLPDDDDDLGAMLPGRSPAMLAAITRHRELMARLAPPAEPHYEQLRKTIVCKTCAKEVTMEAYRGSFTRPALDLWREGWRQDPTNPGDNYCPSHASR
jgi:hypothetical protein